MDKPDFREGTVNAFQADDLDDPHAYFTEYELGHKELPTNELMAEIARGSMIGKQEPKREDYPDQKEYLVNLTAWLRHQHALADLEARKNENPVNKRHRRDRREREQKLAKVMSHVDEILKVQDLFHNEIADALYKGPEGQGLSHKVLKEAVKAYLRKIGRSDLILGIKPPAPSA